MAKVRKMVLNYGERQREMVLNNGDDERERERERERVFGGIKCASCLLC